MNTANSTLNAILPPESAGRRFDAALADLFPDYSRSRLSQWIKILIKWISQYRYLL